MSIQDRQGKVITIVSTYRASPGNRKLGEYSYFKQQYHLMMKKGIEDPNPRTQVIKDLEEFLKRLNYQEEIVMSIDANEMKSHPIKPHTISSHILNLRLINLNDTIPETGDSHKRGRLIDHCTITSSLFNKVKIYGFLPYDRITNIDHRLSYLDLNIHLLFEYKPEKAP